MTKTELIKRDLVRLANHLDHIGHRDLADRVDAVLTKQAFWGDAWDAAKSYGGDVVSTVGDSLSQAGSGLANMGGAVLDVVDDYVVEPVSEHAQSFVEDAAMFASEGLGVNPLTDEEMYARQQRKDVRHSTDARDMGDFGQGAHDLVSGLATGVAAPALVSGQRLYDAGQAGYDAMKEDFISSVPNTSGQRAAQAIRERASREQGDVDTLAQADANTQSAIDASEAARTGATAAPSVERSWGTEYWPQEAGISLADRYIIRDLQEKLGTAVDGQFGRNSMLAWETKMGGVTLPETPQAALDMANATLASMKPENLLKTASIEDKMQMLSMAFSSGVPGNVRR